MHSNSATQLLITTMVMTLIGCQSASNITHSNQKSLHQPQIDVLQPMETSIDSPTMPISQPPKESLSKIDNPQTNNDGSLTTTSSKLATQRSTSHIFDSNWEKLKNPVMVKNYEVSEGEVYIETLSKWIKSMGYKNVHTVFTEEDEALFNEKSNEPKVFLETLPAAIEDALMWIHSEEEPEDPFGKIYISFSGENATIYSATPQILIHHQNEINKPAKPLPEVLNVYRGETYEAALIRWINDSGYDRFGKLVTPNSQKVLSQVIPQTATFNEPLEKAATLLFHKARNQARKDSRTERQNFITNKAKTEVQHHLYLDGAKKEAILTSTSQPVVMFNVVPGSLKDNFITMSKAFGWKAEPSHYIADEYLVQFGYPIVAEKGNLNLALNILLADYAKLRGAIVPSTREAYVVMER